MGKTSDLFKKIRDTKGTFHAKMGLIKDRYKHLNAELQRIARIDMVWTEQKQKILRRGGKNTQKNCTKKIFMTQIITML